MILSLPNSQFFGLKHPISSENLQNTSVVLHLSLFSVVLFFSVCFIRDFPTPYKSFRYALYFLFPHGKLMFLVEKHIFPAEKHKFLALKHKM